MLTKSSWSHMHNCVGIDCLDETSGLMSVDSEVLDHRFRSDHLNSIGDGFYPEYQTDLRHLDLSNIYAPDNEMGLFRNDCEDKSCSDLCNYGWLDIGNFEDVDRLFRNCDSTFGQEHEGSANESWSMSSSQAADDIENAFKLRSQAADATENALSRMKPETDTKYKAHDEYPIRSNPNACSTSNALGYWPSDNAESPDMGFNRFTRWGVTCETEMQSIDHKQASKQMKSNSQIIAEMKEGCYSLENLNGMSRFPNVEIPSSSPERNLWEPSFMTQFNGTPSFNTVALHQYAAESDPLLKTENENAPMYHRTLHDLFLKNSASLSDESMQNLRIEADLACGPREHLVFPNRSSNQDMVQEQLSSFWYGGTNRLEDVGVELAGSSNIQESSCMSSMLPNNIAFQASSFQQLHTVLEQLDVRTKLCMRDGLYRLAHSAAQRRTHNDDKDGRIRCEGSANSETNTNPIDRTIAHLLFYHASEPAKDPVSNAVSLESRIVIEGSRATRPEISYQNNGMAVSESALEQET